MIFIIFHCICPARTLLQDVKNLRFAASSHGMAWPLGRRAFVLFFSFATYLEPQASCDTLYFNSNLMPLYSTRASEWCFALGLTGFGVLLLSLD
jgi:hypothetical protein